MLGWIAALRKDERGQGLVLAALAMSVVMGFAAMAVDAGSFYQERRGLQNAADAAALAGAQELPQNPSAAVQKATEYAGLNEPGATVQVTTPYLGDARKIEVRVSRQFGWLFGRVLGMTTSEVAARAVAQRAKGYAIFQTDPNCDEELEIQGNSLYVDGSVHGDGEVELDGNNGTVTGAFTWVCDFENDGNGWTFGSGPTQLPDPVPPPVDFEYSDFPPCTFSSGGDLNITKNTGQYWQGGSFNYNHTLVSGVYCAGGSISLDVTQVTGNVTFVAHGDVKIKITGNNYNFTPYRYGVLAFTDGSNDGDDDDHDGHHEGEIELEGNYGTFTGMLLAPNGEVELEGNNLTSTGTLLLGNEVEIDGNSISLTGQNISGVPGQVHLVE